MAKTFIKKIEDFTCEHCGVSVKGTGYTNHCPQCLWSKHVDIFPGDRAALCKGQMKPITLEMEKDGFVITHKCVLCGHEKRNKVQKGDVLDQLIASIAKQK